MKPENNREQNLVSSLSLMINDYLASHPKLSVNALAQRAGVSVSSLRRIVLQEVKSDLAPHIVLNIVSYLLRERCIRRLINSGEGAIFDYLKKNFSAFATEDNEHEVIDQEDVDLHDFDKYMIYKLAANRSGVKVVDIRDLLGERGADKCLEMLEDKVLYSEDSKTLHAAKKNFSMPLDVAVKHMPKLVEFYRLKEVSLGQNLFYSLSESVNATTVQRIKEVSKAAIKEIHTLISDPSNHGTIPYFCLFLHENILGASKWQLDQLAAERSVTQGSQHGYIQENYA